ncbi:unnamed protein product [Microthlaspi erraticum]|uniref:Uncharacterized protein n=1 Tax=Microthlaspi erraticum TaxID=1685480 RepID=A0A6D2JPX9_9BRAS|nr:unnamed protein product [Microthlaspi erraticum]
MACRQSDCLTKYLLNTYATPFQCVAVAHFGSMSEMDGVARGCGARGRGARGRGGRARGRGGRGRLWTSADSGESVRLVWRLRR